MVRDGEVPNKSGSKVERIWKVMRTVGAGTELANSYQAPAKYMYIYIPHGHLKTKDLFFLSVYTFHQSLC